MKYSYYAAERGVETLFSTKSVYAALFLMLGFFSLSVLESCTKEKTDVLDRYSLSPQAAWELQQARSASSAYRDFDKAIADGYADINVIVPNMGYHYLKSTEVDETFDYRKPEILVYNKHSDGKMELVAVEYAVPLTLSANAPAGFTGNEDVWDRNTTFGLWLLHAWVWAYNPAGVFNPTNASVHVH